MKSSSMIIFFLSFHLISAQLNFEGNPLTENTEYVAEESHFSERSSNHENSDREIKKIAIKHSSPEEIQKSENPQKLYPIHDVDSKYEYSRNNSGIKLMLLSEKVKESSSPKENSQNQESLQDPKRKSQHFQDYNFINTNAIQQDQINAADLALQYFLNSKTPEESEMALNYYLQGGQGLVEKLQIEKQQQILREKQLLQQEQLLRQQKIQEEQQLEQHRSQFGQQQQQQQQRINQEPLIRQQDQQQLIRNQYQDSRVQVNNHQHLFQQAENQIKNTQGQLRQAQQQPQGQIQEIQSENQHSQVRMQVEHPQMQAQVQYPKIQVPQSQILIQNSQRQTQAYHSQAHRAQQPQTHIHVQYPQAQAEQSQVQAQSLKAQYQHPQVQMQQPQAQVQQYQIQVQQPQAQVQQVHVQDQQSHVQDQQYRIQVKKAQDQAQQHQIRIQQSQVQLQKPQIKLQQAQVQVQKPQIQLQQPQVQAQQYKIQVEIPQAQVQQSPIKLQQAQDQLQHQIQMKQPQDQKQQHKIQVKQPQVQEHQISQIQLINPQASLQNQQVQVINSQVPFRQAEQELEPEKQQYHQQIHNHQLITNQIPSSYSYNISPRVPYVKSRNELIPSSSNIYRPMRRSNYRQSFQTRITPPIYKGPPPPPIYPRKIVKPPIQLMYPRSPATYAQDHSVINSPAQYEDATAWFPESDYPPPPKDIYYSQLYAQSYDPHYYNYIAKTGKIKPHLYGKLKPNEEEHQDDGMMAELIKGFKNHGLKNIMNPSFLLGMTIPALTLMFTAFMQRRSFARSDSKSFSQDEVHEYLERLQKALECYRKSSGTDDRCWR